MECRGRVKHLLRANAAFRVLAGGGRGIHFVPGPASGDEEEERAPPPSRRWYRAAYARLLRLAGSLRGVERGDGGGPRHAETGSVVADARVADRLAEFDALAARFAAGQRRPPRASPLSPLKATSLSSLSRVCDVLGVSAQLRKSVRLTICPQVMQHHIWRGALEEVLRDLRADMAALDHHSPSTQMAEQIATACVRFLSDTADEATSSSPSWMRPTPFNKPADSPPPTPSKTWQEVLDMFTDLAKSLETDARLASHADKVAAMKEGLYQIRNVVVERDIAFKEARRQDCLVQKKLTKSLGHSSKCLYTILLFYLYGNVRDVEVHAGKHFSGKGGKNVTVHAAKFLIDGDELAIRSAVKHLSRAIGIFRFVWEAAHADNGDHANGNGKGGAMAKKGHGEDAKGLLKLQGHIWGLGVEEKENVMTNMGSLEDEEEGEVSLSFVNHPAVQWGILGIALPRSGGSSDAAEDPSDELPALDADADPAADDAADGSGAGSDAGRGSGCPTTTTCTFSFSFSFSFPTRSASSKLPAFPLLLPSSSSSSTFPFFPFPFPFPFFHHAGILLLTKKSLEKNGEIGYAHSNEQEGRRRG
uniref:Uncharacterized protein n=1 Tax=Oryza punctata TaxID=4537 RepID=A0A0E0MDP1_ORYPU